MTADERRSAHLLLGEELALGEVGQDAVLRSAAVAEAVRTSPVPSRLSRRLQERAVASGKLTLQAGSVAPMVAARQDVLGADAAGPPRFLLRLTAFPHPAADQRPEGHGPDAFRAVDAVLRDHAVPYLVAVPARVPTRPDEPGDREGRVHSWEERELLEALRDDRGRPGGDVAFGVGGLDHRTRTAVRKAPSELTGLKRKDLEERLDAADAALRVAGLDAEVLCPPWDRVDARSFAVVAARYAVVTGGTGSIGELGWHRTPLWRSGAVYLPSQPPLDGPAAQMATAVAELEAARPGLWLALTVDWAAEAVAGLDGLRRLAAALAGRARPWDEFLAAVRASRTGLSDDR